MNKKIIRALDKDMAVVHEDGTAEYVDNATSTDENIVEEQETAAIQDAFEDDFFGVFAQ